ncbi:hypothetical protein BG262_02940 [Floricoccus penangensis]|uniref:Uncharacterized protein n=1 Tax=Floricoccus penangensis TaxID=1859475 RepID=A0A9Q5JGA8_9LACT|nr:hypothetical protein [Floricoccus penangensis]OFI46770.1 hypothetical protein BG262_02940 [Floricoccus penangensis]
MGCSSCGQNNNVSTYTSNASISVASDNSDKISIDTNKAWQQISNGDSSFCLNEINEEICKNIAADNGIHPYKGKSNSSCDDMNALNDYGLGTVMNDLNSLSLCDINSWKCIFVKLISWLWNMNKAMICFICGTIGTIACQNKKIDLIIQSFGEKGLPTPTTIFDGGLDGVAQNSYSFPNYDDFDSVEIEWRSGSSRGIQKFAIESLKSDNAHLYVGNMNDEIDEDYTYEAFTRLENGNVLSIDKMHTKIDTEQGKIFRWENNGIFICKIIAYKYIKPQDIKC